MQLKYKISLSIALVSLVVLWLGSYVFSTLSYTATIKHEKSILVENASSTANDIKSELLNKLDNIKTLSSAPIVLQSLKENNLEYTIMDESTRKSHIASLNKKWMKAYDENNLFVKPYLNNALALFLKQQQSMFKDVYGEIFITNSCGALVASTGKLTTLAHAHKYWWKEAYANGKGKIFFDDRGFDASVNGYVIGIVIPIRHNGEILGILKANISIMRFLNNIVSSYMKIHSPTELKIVRTKGDIVYENTLPPLSTTINPEILKHLRDMKTGSDEIKDYFQDTLIAFAPINLSADNEDISFGGKINTTDNIKGNDRESWHTVISYQKNLALEENNKMHQIIIYVGLVFTLLSFIVAYYVGYRISEPIDKLTGLQSELLRNEKVMLMQSRNAAMGEMISMVAHQWRQPISAISMVANNILLDIELDALEKKTLKENSKNIVDLTQELSKTIDDFRDFFKPQKKIEEVFVKEVVESALRVIGKSLEHNQITVSINTDKTAKLKTHPRELMQVIINLINNAKDVLLEKEIENKQVSIKASKTSNTVLITIEDNGGGIDEAIIDNIFNPYFTTKEEKNGTGLGLYMSKIIVEKHLKGVLKAKNINDGACFSIELSETI